MMTMRARLVIIVFLTAFFGLAAVNGSADADRWIEPQSDVGFVQDALTEAASLVETLADDGYSIQVLHLEYMEEPDEHLVVEEFRAGAEYVIAAIADPRIENLHLTAYAPYGDVINTDTGGGRHPRISLRTIADSQATLEFAAVGIPESSSELFILYIIAEKR